MADRIDKTIIRIEADQQAAKKLQSEIARTRTDMRGLTQDVKASGLAGLSAESQFAEYGDSAASTGRRIDSLNDVMDRLRRETLDAASAQGDLERSMKGVQGTADAQARSMRDLREGAQIYGDIESRTRSITGAVGYIGGEAGARIERYANVGTEALGAIEGVKLLKLELPQLSKQLLDSGFATRASVSALQGFVPNMSKGSAQMAVAAGSAALMAGAMVALFAAFKIGQNIIEDSKEAVEGYIEVNQRFAEIIATGTTEEVQAAIRSNEERNKALELEREGLQALVDAVQAEGGWKGAVLDLNDALGLNVGGIEDVKNRLEEINETVAQNTTLNDRLVVAMQNGATTAADLAAAEDELTERRKQASQDALALIDQQIADEIDLRRKVSSYTPEQVDVDIQANEAEIDALKHALQSLREEYDAGKISMVDYRNKQRELQDSIRGLTAENEQLDTVVRRAAIRRQAAAEAEKVLEDATTTATKAVQDLAAAEAKRTSLLDSYAQKTEEIAYKRQVDDTRAAEDAYRKQAKDRAQHNADLIGLDRKYLQDRASLIQQIAETGAEEDKKRVQALRDFQKEEARATVRYWQDIRRINRDERISVASAAARLNATAVREAQQNADTQRRDRTEQYELERKERAEDNKERLDELEAQREAKRSAAAEDLRDLERKHRDERAERIRAFNQQQSEEAAEARIRQQRLKADRDYEDALRQQQFDAELASINNLIVAAETLERRAQQTIRAANAGPSMGGGGAPSTTSQYYQQIAQTAGRYVTFGGQRVRTDMYDPGAAAGMTAGEWYAWKQRYGYQRGGYTGDGPASAVAGAVHHNEYVLNGGMIRRLDNFFRGGMGATYHTRNAGGVIINIYESFNAQRTAEAVRMELSYIV